MSPARVLHVSARLAQWVAGAVVAGLAAGCPGPDPCASPSPGSICPVAGTGDWGFNRDGLPAVETDLYLLSAVRRGPDGLVYLMDFNNQRLRVVDEGGSVQTIAGNGWHAVADTSVPAVDSPLENPIDFDFLPDGRLVFVSYHDPRVILLERDGSLVTIAGTGEVGLRGDEGDFGPPLDALFIQLDGIAIAPDGAIYVSDSIANRVRLIRDDVITTVAGTGREAYSGDGGPGTDATLHWPTALELDPEGNVLIADQRNHVVRRLSPEGTIDTIAGTGTAGFAGDGGAATGAQLDQPYGLALAPDGSLYISDRGNFRVRRVAPDGIIDTIAGTGAEGYAGDGGPAVAAQFGYLARLDFDEQDGALLVADQSNSCARRITPTQQRDGD
jgi:sugar lactone lactonase YvrE